MATDSPDTFLGARGFAQADYTLSRWQKLAALVFVAAIVMITLNAKTESLLLWVNGLFATLFLISTVYRLYLIDISLKQPEKIEVASTKLEPPNGEWPRYVIQVPLYREANALPHLMEAMRNLDYPPERMAVQLLVEEDDEQTRDALSGITIAPPFEVVYVPVSYPRTKPKACNVGLARAEGDYLVIYDAEDRPDPDQLKKAVIAFAGCDSTIACIQAKLNFYNTNRNLITRCFTAEYAMWFDLCLPGLDHLRAPIPLGGTSNHFRLEILKELKGWDEYNVTEDCDLGLRLFARGWRTRILDSTTWEEACPRLFSWIRQRSRWVKGYVQTYLVQTRALRQLTGKLGVANSLHFHLLIGGSVFTQLISPFYWLLVMIWLVWQPKVIGEFFPGPVFAMAALCLFVGNFALVYCCAIACQRRDLGTVVKFTPLMIIYWIIACLAAWKGTLQLVWKPHFWEKTQHHEG